VVRLVGLVAGYSGTLVEVRSEMSAMGRDPDASRVMYIASPILGETDEEAWALARRRVENSKRILETRLSAASRHFTVDLSQFDLDKPIPADLETNGHAGTLARFIASGKTLRELMSVSVPDDGPTTLIGSPKTVAQKLGAMAEEVGGDGFLFSNIDDLARVFIAQICDGLVPELQRMGLTRKDYEYPQLRQNLLAF
jgi:alkanesulfonate monooxygenase SsuD/methylene tetrahydromethanopterin reductase-like flavin-dependent oxidoreductase (luciferase family)